MGGLGRTTPWLFGDELELAQLSRAVADTGQRRGAASPYTFKTLYTYLMAPAWWIDDAPPRVRDREVHRRDLMTATVFPAYGIARMIVGKWPALFVAAGAAAIPPIAYSSMIVEEPLAYPYATL